MTKLARLNLSLLQLVTVEVIFLWMAPSGDQPAGRKEIDVPVTEHGIVSGFFAGQLQLYQQQRTSFVAFSDSGDQIIIQDTNSRSLAITFDDTSASIEGD